MSDNHTVAKWVVIALGTIGVIDMLSGSGCHINLTGSNGERLNLNSSDNTSDDDEI